MNVFLDLQDRLAALLRAHTYFAGLSAGAILTEKIGDLDHAVANDLLPLGFGVVIATAKGEAEGSLSALLLRETLTVSIIHHPTTEPAKNVLDALAAAVAAIHGKPLAAATTVRQAQDCWRVISHERVADAPEDIHAHQLLVQATLKFS